MEFIQKLKIKDIYIKNTHSKRITLYITKFVDKDKKYVYVSYDKDKNQLIISL